MSQLRKLQRNVDRQGPEEVPVNHAVLPTGQVLSSPVRGDFLALPLFGWVAQRARTGTPLVMITTLLLRSVEDPKPRGTLQIELPVLDETEIPTLAALERFGWAGRVWPGDPGWPEEDPAARANLEGLLKQARLPATLVFEPGEEGSVRAQAVTVARARGPFLMPALESPEAPPDEGLLARFREVCVSKLFIRP